ncbi:sporulation protein [Pontibacter vulgaris]|uniref:sporulation protein n=1 Tax=Pontibacter vulgaris TaxID=2905679 RepID=UPI001FA750B1|nr:sporulation protein [Pontibacter vulgaris]
MNRTLSLILSLLFVIITACASSSGTATSETKTSGGKAKTAEDLSVYRPKYPVADAGTTTPAARPVPANHVNDKVEALLDTVANVNKSIRYAQGYRILAYNGSERQTVMNLRKTIIARVPEQKDYLTYQQPNFRLKVGDFFSRVEAQQVLNQLRDILPNALIVSDQITINKSVGRGR